jgi:hypothetical protein
VRVRVQSVVGRRVAHGPGACTCLLFVVCGMQNMCITVTVMQAHNRAPMSSSDADWREWLQWVRYRFFTSKESEGLMLAGTALSPASPHAPYRDRQLAMLSKNPRLSRSALFNGESPDTSHLLSVLDRTPADIATNSEATHLGQPHIERREFMTNLLLHHRVVSDERLYVQSGRPVSPVFQSAFLGLKKLRGPVDYCFLQGFKIGIVLLGDWHTGSICTKSCIDTVTCKSMQAIKTSRGAVPSGVDMSFLDYLDNTFGHLKPDLFLETWLTDDERYGIGRFKVDNLEPYNTGPLATVEAFAEPCLDPARRATECPFRNLRIHAVDPRVKDHRVRLPLEKILDTASSIEKHALKGNKSPEDVMGLLKWMKSEYPQFTIEEVVRGVLDISPLASVTQPFCKAYGRTYHEFRQLPTYLQSKLLRAIDEVVTVRPIPYDVAGAVVGWLAMAATAADVKIDLSLGRGFDVVIGETALPAVADIALHPLVLDDCITIHEEWPYNARAELELEIYAISRALKNFLDSPHESLVVMNLGYVHTDAIARFLLHMGFELKAKIDRTYDKCLDFTNGVDPWGSDDSSDDVSSVDSSEFVDVYNEPMPERTTGLLIPKAPFGIVDPHRVFNVLKKA